MATSGFRRPLIAALFVLLLLWAAALAVTLRTSGQGSFPTSAVVDRRFSARPGMNLTRQDLADGNLAPKLAEISRLGPAYVRFTLPWDEIEPEPGRFDWQTWDNVLAALSLHGALEPVVVLDRSPTWSRRDADRDNPLAPPHERRNFGAFATAVAARYGDRITYYQIWDEPNIAPHWGLRPADPADYLGLLREATVNLRAVDRDAHIVAAALAPTVEAGGANLSDVTFLDQLYALGGRAWFDYPAGQPYGFTADPNQPAGPSRLNFGRAELLRQVMLRHDDAATPLWATAFGWDAEAAGAAPWGRVSAADQAAYTQAAFARAQQAWPWLGPLVWTGKFAPMPETAAVLAQAAAAPVLLGPGYHATDSPALDYRGWRVAPAAADPGREGDVLGFTFFGTGVALDVQGGSYWAYLTATVDGGLANRLPRDESGGSYLVLHDPTAAPRVAPLAEGLPLGEHTVQLIAHGGWGQWPLRGIVVSDAGRQSSALALVLVGLAALGTMACAVVVVRGGVVWRAVAANPEHGAPVAPSAAPARGRFFEAAVWVLAIGLSGLFLLATSGAVNLLLLALLGLLFLARPQLAPPLIAAALPWWQRTQPVLRWQFGLFEVLAWLAVLAWAARTVLAWLGAVRWAARRPFPSGGWVAGRWPRLLDLSILALFAAGLLASLAAAEQGVAWREFRIVFLFGLVVYSLVTRGPGRPLPGRARDLVLGLLAGATVASLAGLWQLLSGQGRVNVEGVGRIAGFYGSPNNLALILDRALPLAASIALFGVDFWQNLGPAGQRWPRIIFAGAATVMLAAAIATFSKGAFLLGLPVGLAVVLVGGAWRSRQRWPLGLLLALMLMAGLALVVLFRTPRFADLFNFAGGTSFFRLKLWQGALNMALDHPLLGVGPDNFLYAYRTRYVLPSAWQELNLSHPHNLILDLWTRLGLVGLGAGLAALAVAFAGAWRLFRPAVGSDAKSPWPLFGGLLGGLAATVAHGLIDNSLFLPDLMGWFAAALAIVWLYLVVGGAASSGVATNEAHSLENRGLT